MKPAEYNLVNPLNQHTAFFTNTFQFTQADVLSRDGVPRLQKMSK